jgi:hypothetical protein
MMPSIFQNRAIDERDFFVPAVLIHNGSEDEIEHFIEQQCTLTRLKLRVLPLFVPAATAG